MVIRWMIRLVLLPIVIALTVLEWCGTYVVRSAGMLCRLLSGTYFLIAVVAWLVGFSTAKQVVNVLMAGVILYLIPEIGRVVVTGVALVDSAIIDLMNC